MLLTRFIHIMDGLLINMIWWYSFPDFFPVSRFSSDFHKIFRSHKLYNYFLFRKSFQCIFQIFPDFHQIYQLILFLSLLCSRSRTLKDFSLVFVHSFRVSYCKNASRIRRKGENLLEKKSFIIHYLTSCI